MGWRWHDKIHIFLHAHRESSGQHSYASRACDNTYAAHSSRYSFSRGDITIRDSTVSCYVNTNNGEEDSKSSYIDKEEPDSWGCAYVLLVSCVNVAAILINSLCMAERIKGEHPAVPRTTIFKPVVQSTVNTMLLWDALTDLSVFKSPLEQASLQLRIVGATASSC